MRGCKVEEGGGGGRRDAEEQQRSERGMEEKDGRGREGEREEQQRAWHSVCCLAGGISSRTMDCFGHGS